jgi:predicted DNA-binding transcriptional regulator YafY
MLGIVVILLNRDRISARYLAERFEVSVRTIYRDIEAINLAGIPVISYQGIKGGLGIMENYKLNRQLISVDDMAAIISALKGVNSSLDDNDLDSVAEKILTLVPADKTDYIKKYFDEFFIDLVPWGFKQKSKEYVKVLQSAISEGKVVKFSYRNTRGETICRSVEPMTVIFKGYAWYLFAYCRNRNDYRIFRLSRMDNLETADEKFTRRNMSYHTYIGSTSNQAEFVKIKLKFSPEVKIRVEEYFDESVVECLKDGSLIVSVCYPEDEWVYSTILSFGEFVEVLEPVHIRKIIHEKAKK